MTPTAGRQSIFTDVMKTRLREGFPWTHYVENFPPQNWPWLGKSSSSSGEVRWGVVRCWECVQQFLRRCFTSSRVGAPHIQVFPSVSSFFVFKLRPKSSSLFRQLRAMTMWGYEDLEYISHSSRGRQAEAIFGNITWGTRKSVF